MNETSTNTFDVGWRFRFGLYYVPVIIEVRSDTLRLLDRALKPLVEYPVKGMRLHRTKFDYLIFPNGKGSLELFPLPGRLNFGLSTAQKDLLNKYNQDTTSDARAAQMVSTTGLGVAGLSPSSAIGAAGAVASIAADFAELKLYFKRAADFKSLSETLATQGAVVDVITDWRGALKITAQVLLAIVVVFAFAVGFFFLAKH